MLVSVFHGENKSQSVTVTEYVSLKMPMTRMIDFPSLSHSGSHHVSRARVGIIANTGQAGMGPGTLLLPQ